MVGTTNKSVAAISGVWLRKKVRHPWLGGSRRLNMYLGDARLRDLKPELEQFAVDAWRAPKRIFEAHPPDQYAQRRVDLRSPELASPKVIAIIEQLQKAASCAFRRSAQTSSNLCAAL